jgi:hypothetical protein
VRRTTQATKPSRAKRLAIAPPVPSPAPMTSATLSDCVPATAMAPWGDV